MVIIADIFGHTTDPITGDPQPVKRFTFTTKKGIKVQVISLGATISDVICPDKNGKLDHVVLGFDSTDGHLASKYIGTTIGRSTNRIGKGRFQIGGHEFLLSINNNHNHLHGGSRGWDKFNWDSYVASDHVVFSHVSPDGDEGYPGTVLAQVTYSLSEEGELRMDYRALCTSPTIIDMTNHSFFNLGGITSGQQGTFDTSMQILADHYLPVSDDLIPTGEIVSVENTKFDLRQPTLLADALKDHPGFDHCYCAELEKSPQMKHVASAHHKASGRTLDVYTTQPGVQFYSGNFMPKDPGVLIGRNGFSYTYQGAFCLEPQNFPNAVNQENFPDAIVYPGQEYQHRAIYKFGLK